MPKNVNLGGLSLLEARFINSCRICYQGGEESPGLEV